jgi:hypothetical protein
MSGQRHNAAGSETQPTYHACTSCTNSPDRQPRKLLSEQLRELIEDGQLSRYRISKETGIDASQLCDL